MDEIGLYPVCGVCGKGRLLPVVVGNDEDPSLKYMCTNPVCGARFDQYGYETYDRENKMWVRAEI